MTRKVVTASPLASVAELAEILRDNKVSALPIVSAEGRLLGIVSEGDLVRRQKVELAVQSSWWLEMLGEGEGLSPEFLAYVKKAGKTARDLMSHPVRTVGEDTPVAEVARLLETAQIKRVPVMRGDELVGIVSRADLVRLLASGVG